MEFRLNREGVQYIVGMPLKDKPHFFSQVILHPGELAWLPKESMTIAFSTLEEAQRAVEELGDELPQPLAIYKVSVAREKS